MLLHKLPLHASCPRMLDSLEGMLDLSLHLYGDRALLPLTVKALQAGASALPLNLLTVHAAGLAPAQGPWHRPCCSLLTNAMLLLLQRLAGRALAVHSIA